MLSLHSEHFDGVEDRDEMGAFAARCGAVRQRLGLPARAAVVAVMVAAFPGRAAAIESLYAVREARYGRTRPGVPGAALTLRGSSGTRCPGIRLKQAHRCGGTR
jgi:hypothetical protein